MTDRHGAEGRRRGPADLLARGTVAVLAVVGLLLLASISCHRAFQVDEVEHLHAAYHLRAGRALYTEAWQVHMPLLYAALAPIVDVDDPRASYQRARALHLLLLLATILVASRCAARIAAGAGRSRPEAELPAGALAATLLLWHTTFVERGMEVRADGPLALCVVVTLWLGLGTERAGAARSITAGAVLGLAFLLTQKAVFATAAFAVGWLYDAMRERRPRSVLLPALGWSAPVAFACGWIALAGGLRPFWRDAILGAAAAAGRVEERRTFSPLGFLLQEGERNVAFSAIVLLGLSVAVGVSLRARRGGVATSRDHDLAHATLLAVVSLATLWLQPFPWPYVHVSVLPPLAIVGSALAGRALVSPTVARRRLAWPAVALALCLQAATSAPRLVAKAVPQRGTSGHEHQLATIEEVQRVTNPEDPVFDLAGLYFRPDGYPAYALSGDLYRLYRAGGLPRMVPALRRSGAVAFVYNYRVGWLRGEEQAFLHERFAHHSGNVFLLGRELGALPVGVDVPFEVLRTKRFRYDGPASALLVDGQPFSSGELSRGVHVLRLQRSAAGARLILEVPEPRPPRHPPAPLYVAFD
jgi:hypothetical protein